jgi:hypothetical protein
MSDVPIDLKTAQQHAGTREAPGRSAAQLGEFVARSVEAARVSAEPFHHGVLDRVFPDDVYAAMRNAMPGAAAYRPMHGRSTENDLPDGTHTRVKIDLFPEYVRRLPESQRAVWNLIGAALRSRAVRDAFVRLLAPGLRQRFGDRYADLALYAVPVLTRDVAGYLIRPHTDTRWKAITVQLYLPPDDRLAHVGTILHGRAPDGAFTRHTRMRFAPNTGYAFAVGADTWHSADRLGPEVTTRDSILLNYFVDAGPLRIVRNRGKRVGNFLLNELRFWTGR